MSVISEYVEAIETNGYIVIEGLLSPKEIQNLRDQVDGILQTSPFGRNEFEGLNTKRIYALLAKIPDVAALVEHPLLLDIVDALLPRSYLLSSLQAIKIHAGETPQSWHRDDSVGVLPMPRRHFGVSTMWALDDFTKENGGTELVPGSHLWGAAHDASDAKSRVIEMPAGSVLIFLANVLHRGGANGSQSPRLGISPQYCVPWLRQSENMVLAVPREKVRSFSGRIQSLLGYELVAPGFAGHVGGRHPKSLL